MGRLSSAHRSAHDSNLQPIEVPAVICSGEGCRSGMSVPHTSKVSPMTGLRHLYGRSPAAKPLCAKAATSSRRSMLPLGSSAACTSNVSLCAMWRPAQDSSFAGSAAALCALCTSLLAHQQPASPGLWSAACQQIAQGEADVEQVQSHISAT